MAEPKPAPVVTPEPAPVPAPIVVPSLKPIEDQIKALAADLAGLKAGGWGPDSLAKVKALEDRAAALEAQTKTAPKADRGLFDEIMADLAGFFNS